MKRTFILILTLCLVLSVKDAFVSPAAASDRNLIYTEGTAEIMGQNDSAKIYIAVVTQGRKLETAGSENANKTKIVLKVIKGLKIKNLKLETVNYGVTPQRDYKARPPKIKGYEVHNSVAITLEEFDTEPLSKHVSKIVGSALESGANSIQRIQFYLNDKSVLEKKALTLATKKAVERAKILSEAAGVKLKGIVSLSTQPMYTPPRPHMLRAAEMKADAGAMAPPMEIGESRIRVQVSIAYEIAP